MHRQKLFIALLIIVSMFSLSGCAKKENLQKTPKQIVKINIKDEPESIDPRLGKTLGALMLDRMLYEGATRIGKSGKPELACADKIDLSEDLKTYTIFLREAFWSNGDPVKSSDFIHSIKESLSPLFPSDTSEQLFCIKNARAVKKGEMGAHALGIEQLDDKIFKITLDEHCPYFLELLALPVFFPVHTHTQTSSDEIICNGPFKLNKWEHNYKIELVKNPDYWDADQVKLDGIELVMVAEETEYSMFERGELDWAGSPVSILSVEVIPKLKREGKLEISPLLGTQFVRLNTSIEPLSNVNIRKAFSYAINRKLITEHIMQGGQLVATGLVPTALSLKETPYFQDGDSDNAAKLYQTGLAEEGINPFSMPQLTLIYAASGRTHLIAQALQDQWKNVLGINIKLESLEPKVYYSRVSNKEYQLALGSWIGDYNDPINFLEIFKEQSGRRNNTNWSNEQYAQLIGQSYLTADQRKRVELFRKSEQILINEMPILPIYHYAMLHVQNEKLKGVLLSPLGLLDFKYAYFVNRD